MHKALEQYRYLLNDTRKLAEIPYRELQQIAGILAPLGFFPGCRNITKQLLIDQTYQGLVELDLALNPHKLLESEPQSTQSESVVALKPVKRDYPITTYSALHGYKTVKASWVQRPLQWAIERFLSDEDLLFPEAKLCWSQAS